jgi:tight adherence protein B
MISLNSIPVVIIVLVFLAVVLIVQLIARVFFAATDRTKRVNRRLTMLGTGVSREKVFETLVRRKPGSGSVANALPDLMERVNLYFNQAGLAMSPQRYVLFVGLAAIPICGAAVVVMNEAIHGGIVVNLLVSILGAIGLAVTGGVITITVLRARRLKRLEEQLPLALEVVVRALRAGHPLVMAMKLAADEMGDPLGSEFGLIIDETSYGLEFRIALENFAHRAGSNYVHFFAVSVAIQAETGGNLAEILGNLNRVIRDNQTLHLRVQALASEGKTSATVLTGLPIVLISYLMLTQPAFYTSKFGDPIFCPAVGATFCLYMLGQFIISRMVNFKY